MDEWLFRRAVREVEHCVMTACRLLGKLPEMVREVSYLDLVMLHLPKFLEKVLEVSQDSETRDQLTYMKLLKKVVVTCGESWSPCHNRSWLPFFH